MFQFVLAAILIVFLGLFVLLSFPIETLDQDVQDHTQNTVE